MSEAVVLVPVYKPELDPFERYSLDRSLAVLRGRPVFFIGAEGADLAYYSCAYPAVPLLRYSPECFASIPGYNRLLMSTGFYSRFLDYEFLLILQTDAVLLRDDLDFWCAQPFDYVGAPWPDGVELFVNAGRFEGDCGRRVRAMVGNGGLSLRRVRKCISLLDEFADIVGIFDRTGSSEDLFFSIMGTLSQDFIIPNEITASRFSLELSLLFIIG